ARARLLHGVESAAHVFSQFNRAGGWADRPPRAVEKRLTQRFLQPSHLQADGAGGHAHVVGGIGETSVPQDGVEGHQEFELHLSSASTRCGRATAAALYIRKRYLSKQQTSLFLQCGDCYHSQDGSRGRSRFGKVPTSGEARDREERMQDQYDIRMLIDGRWIEGEGPVIPVIDKWTGEALGRVRSAAAAQVDAAVAAARAAFAAVRIEPYERSRLLHRVADLILSDRETLAATIVA